MYDDGGRVELTVLAEDLAGHDLLVKVGLALLDARGEALLLGIVDEGLDGVALPLGGELGLLLLGAGLFALVPPKATAEVGLVPALVVKVGDVGWIRRSAGGQCLDGAGAEPMAMGIPRTPVAAVATEAVTMVDVETMIFFSLGY